MPDGSNVIYLYDGSFDGLMSCVFYSFDRKEVPCDITADDNTLLLLRKIESDEAKAARVIRGIKNKIGSKQLDSVRLAFMSEKAGREKQILEYLRLGFACGESVDRLIAEDCVDFVKKSARYVMNERHKMLQFLRFSDNNGFLTAVIEPSCMVLPLLVNHFVSRFRHESFLIYDRARRMALVYTSGKSAILPVECFSEPEPSEEEMKYRKLFKMFYDTVEIKERHNERCRMNFMPKRFWKNMTEFCTDFDYKFDKNSL